MPSPDQRRLASTAMSKISLLPERGSDRICSAAGRLRATHHDGNATTVRINLREGGDRVLEVDRLINCTGIHESYVDHARPLIGSLVQNGLACANDLGAGFRADPNGALFDASENPSPILFTLGPPRRGELIETTAVPEIRLQAEALVRRLLA